MKFGDINGDGLQDVVRIGSSYEIRISLSQRSSGFPFSALINTGLIANNDGLDRERSWQLLDYNQDGRDDLLLATFGACDSISCSVNWNIHLATTTNGAIGFASTPVTSDLPMFGGPRSLTENISDSQLADFNGDGLVDLLLPEYREEPAGTPKRVVFTVRYLTRNNDTTRLCTTNEVTAICPYRFSAPKVVSLPANIAGLGEQETDKSDVFDFNGDGRADLKMLTSGQLRSAGSGYDVVAYEGDDLFDQPEEAVSSAEGGSSYWTILLAESASEGGINFVHSQTFVDADSGLGMFRVVDLNGDGLADVAYKQVSTGHWYYQLNSGSGFRMLPKQCIWLVNGVCQKIHYEDSLEFQDINGDGWADALQMHDNDSFSTTTQIRQFCGNVPGFTNSHQYGALLGGPTGFSETKRICGVGTTNTGNGPWSRHFNDLDGDGELDYFAFKGNESKVVVNFRSNSFTPRDHIQSITNGMGALTKIEYAPMTFSSVYRRDYSGAQQNFGRGSPVFDLMSPSYLVNYVSSSSPNLGSEQMAHVQYRYAGARMQGGSRGSLGFRKIYSIDLQTKVQTETEYYQAWPFTGRPKSTRALYLGSSWQGSQACGSLGGAAFGGNSAQCFTRAPMCAVSNGLISTCEPSFGDSAGTPQVFSSAQDNWGYRVRTSAIDLAAEGTAFAQTTPQSVFVFAKTSSKSTSFVDGNLAATQNFKVENTAFTSYDGHGNLLTSTSSLKDQSNNTLQSTDSTFTYATAAELELAPIWVPAQVKRSSVTTTRGTLSQTRVSSFDYFAGTAQLKAEHIEPGGAADIALSTYYIRNNFGQVLSKVSCSNHFTEAECTNWVDAQGAKVPGNFVMDSNNPLHIRRFSASVYDTSARFVAKSVSPIDSAVGADSLATMIVSSEVITRNHYGEPTEVKGANGVSSITVYSKMGRALFSGVAAVGSSATTSVQWCSGHNFGEEACPTGAVFVTISKVSGAPESRTYTDVMGREMSVATQSFDGKWNIAAKGYDVLGRVVETSEPYRSSSPDEFRLCGSEPCTKVQYDILGRSRVVIQPEDKPGRLVRQLTNYGLSACTVNGVASNCTREEMTDARNVLTHRYTSVLGEVVQVTENAGSTGLAINRSHDVFGNLVLAQRTPSNGDSAGQVIETRMGYDLLSRKTSMNDPDTGTWTYTYNAMGEVLSQVNANAQCTTSRYDSAGRLNARQDYTSASCSGTAQSSATWQYDLSPTGAADIRYRGVLSKEQESVTGTSRSLIVDAQSRPIETQQIVAGKIYKQRQSYDQFGRPFQSFDMVLSGDGALIAGGERQLGVQFEYNSFGFQSRVLNAQNTADEYYEVIAMNARGQVVQDQRGAQVNLTRTAQFDPATGRLVGLQTQGTLQNWDYGITDNVGSTANNGYDQNGNLRYRLDQISKRRETFTYDNLNRITASVLFDTSGTKETQIGQTLMGYDVLGNLTSKGNLSYTSAGYGDNPGSCARTNIGPHMVGYTSLSGVRQTTYCYDDNGNQISASGEVNRSIVYAVHDKPTQISTSSPIVQRTRYEYGPNRELTRRLEGSITNSVALEAHYVGGVEVQYRNSGNEITYQRTLGSSVVINMKLVKTGTVITRSSERSYKLEEKLGSTDVLVSQAGAVLQRMSFDVWGQRREASNWSALSFISIAGVNSDRTKKGYTGHEMLDHANLIHMGGRMYDPQLARFLSADPIIQAPDMPQSFNRYSYVLNNPMNMTDPTGYSWLSDNWRTIASVAINFWLPGASGLLSKFGANLIWSKVITGMISGAIQSGSLKGALTGGLSAGIFHGIGSHFDKLAGPKGSGALGTGLKAGDFAKKVAAHAAAGGVMSVIQGGKFGHGFASAGFVEAVNPALSGMSGMEVNIASVIIGGTSSVLAGGKFANGAVTASFQLAFNHGHETNGKTRGDALETLAALSDSGPEINTLQDIGITTFYDGESLYVWESRSAVDSRSLPGAAGPYDSTDVNVASGPLHNNARAYGPGDVLRTNDLRGRWLHGGGGRTSVLASRLLQGWVVTRGCTRMQNVDIAQLTSLVKSFQLRNPGVAIPYSRYSTGMGGTSLGTLVKNTAFAISTVQKGGFE